MTTGKKTRSGKVPLLDRQRISQAAMALMDEQGIEQLSMRKLGTALGVEGMALYHYFQSKAELLDGVLDLMLDGIAKRLPTAGPPLVRIRSTFDALRATAVEHPHVFPAMVLRRFRTRYALDFYERLLQLFHDAGLDAEQSARYYRTMANFTVGAGIADVGSRAGHVDAAPVILEDFAQPQTYPRITEAMPYLRVSELDRIYNFGMDILFKELDETLAAALSRMTGP